MTWPLQRDVNEFYGDPRGANGHVSPAWETRNLVSYLPPWKITYGGMPMTKGFRVHRKVADSLGLVCMKIWAGADGEQKVIDDWGMSVFCGSYNYRLIRGSATHLSMHAYGIAIDFDAERNGFYDRTPHFASCPVVLNAFESEGWEWGGIWTTRPDGMHFQAARTR